jgi:hypothetical protein
MGIVADAALEIGGTVHGIVTEGLYARGQSHTSQMVARRPISLTAHFSHSQNELELILLPPVSRTEPSSKPWALHAATHACVRECHAHARKIRATANATPKKILMTFHSPSLVGSGGFRSLPLRTSRRSA